MVLLFLALTSVILGFLFWGMMDLPDSAFYFAIGEYIKSGKYPFTYPYIYSRPTTISPPLYGLFLLPLWGLPRSDIIIHLIQVLILLTTAYFTYKSARYFLPSAWSLIAVSFLLLIPGNTIFTSLVMTEIGAQLLVGIYVYLLLSYFIFKKPKFLHSAILVGLLMGLWKYSLIVYGGVAILILFMKRPKLGICWLLPVTGVLIITGWIFVNHRITNVWGLSDASGIQMYNLVVWNGRLSPKVDNQSWLKLRHYVGTGVNIYRPYWDLQEYILSKNNRNWWEVNSILGSVATAAIKNNPFGYALVVARNFILIHGPTSFYEADWRRACQNAPADFRPFYNQNGTFRLCAPIINERVAQPFWNWYISFTGLFYNYVFPITNYLILLPALILLPLMGSIREKILAVLYLIGVGSTVMIAHLDQRYLMPFYPIVSIVVFSGLHRLTATTKGLLLRLKVQP